MTISIPSHLTDDELVAAIPALAGDERQIMARLIAHLAELDRRQLYVPAGYASLYVYCRERLGYSEDAAYNRTVVAQVARRYPAVIDMLADGRLSPTATKLLAPALNDENWEACCAEAAGQPKREIEKLVARLQPKPDVASTVRKVAVRGTHTPEAEAPGRPAAPRADGDDGRPAVPERPIESPAASERPAAPAKRPVVAPLSPERYRVQFTIGEETERKLRRVQELMKREVPDGDPAVLFDRALTLLLEKVENRKHGAKMGSAAGTAGRVQPTPETAAMPPKAAGNPRASRPMPGGRSRRPSRYVSAGVRRQVTQRDLGQCAFVSADGKRCLERVYLEHHHGPVPFAHDGPGTVDNIQLHCRAHNHYEAKRIFGAYLPREVREARVIYDAMQFAVPERQ